MGWSMKPILWALMLCSLVCGCAHEYVIKLNNGLQVTSASKPKLKGGYYVYTDSAGRTGTVPAVRVLEIEPASMAKEEQNQFKPKSK